jgi:hypothetical protein
MRLRILLAAAVAIAIAAAGAALPGNRDGIPAAGRQALWARRSIR